MKEIREDRYGGYSDSDDEYPDSDVSDDSEDEDSAHRRWVNHTIAIAAKTDHLDIVKYLYNNRRHQPGCKLMSSAAEHDHMEIVKWLHEMQPSCSVTAIGFAAKGGHFEIVQWLYQQTANNIHEKPKQHWIHEHGTERSIDKAAEGGSLEIVQWLHEHRPDACSTAAMNKAAENSHVEILKWLQPIEAKASHTMPCSAQPTRAIN